MLTVTKILIKIFISIWNWCYWFYYRDSIPIVKSRDINNMSTMCENMESNNQTDNNSVFKNDKEKTQDVTNNQLKKQEEQEVLISKFDNDSVDNETKSKTKSVVNVFPNLINNEDIKKIFDKNVHILDLNDWEALFNEMTKYINNKPEHIEKC